MGSGLFKRGEIWFAWIDGRRVSTGLRDKQAAAKRRDELERRAVDPAYALAREATGQRIFDDYARSRRRLGRSVGTMHHLETKAGNLLALMPHMVDDWNLAEFEKYVDARLKDGVRRTTIKKELRVALAALRHARKHHLFDRAPEDIIPELGDDYRPRTRFLTPWELVVLTRALDEENDPLRAAHVVFIVATGARWSESLKAKHGDVGWVDGDETLLRGTKTAAALRSVPTVGVSGSLLLFVKRRAINSEKTMFRSWPNVRRTLLAACKRAGIAPVSPNDLRRTFSTWLQQAGATNDLIAKVMGHTSSRMVERVYGRLPAADVARLLRERVGSGLESGAPNEDGNENSGLGAVERGRGRSLSEGVQATQNRDSSSDLQGASGGFRGPSIADDFGVKTTGSYTGSKQVFSGLIEGNSDSPEKAVSPDKNQAFGSAQRQNRTADTGIFNPPDSAAIVGVSSNSGAGWVAGGLPRTTARAVEAYWRGEFAS